MEEYVYNISWKLFNKIIKIERAWNFKELLDEISNADKNLKYHSIEIIKIKLEDNPYSQLESQGVKSNDHQPQY
jgi:hypothetical protein